MTEDPTEVFLPQSFPFPIRIVSIDAPSGQVSRGSRLLSYSFVFFSKQPSAQPETRFGTWDSALDGEVQKWNISTGDVVSAKKAKERPALVLLEPCKHGMQLGGLCVVCGKDMTIVDYIGFSDASRASIQMDHSAMGPTVSFEIAKKLGESDAERLQKARKLSLIVDLDQTVVHATLDTTVGEWINEGKQWEAKQAEAAAAVDSSGEKSDSSEPAKPEALEGCNPNWEALKDVKSFTLPAEMYPPAGPGPVRSTAGRLVNQVYYIKPRPGWKAFFGALTSKYEMHVYTMGTRAYAEKVCKALDPDGNIFGGRILTRDESGSLKLKNLRRLFPVDTSMVVIIDDRGDVWEYSPNLVKVLPYDFFVGVGDINSTFLPKQGAIPAAKPVASPGHPPATSEESPKQADEKVQEETSTLLTLNQQALAAQVEERPLAKLSEAIQESSSDATEDRTEKVKGQSQPSQNQDHPSGASSEKHHRKPLLKDNDKELIRLQELLEIVHRQYYDAYDLYQQSSPSSKGKEATESKKGKGKLKPRPPLPDVTRIIPPMRLQVFQGVSIVFSGIIPSDVNPEHTDIWRMTLVYGGKCFTELNDSITHVITNKGGTVKTDAARRRGGIHIVLLQWLQDSVSRCKRQDEANYYVDGPPAPPQTKDTPSDESEYDDWRGNLTASGSSLQFTDVDWATVNDEVDAAMNESDDDEYDVKDTPMVDNVKSDDESSDDTSSNLGSQPGTPAATSRKRARSRTPSDVGRVGDQGDELRSPLAKRKKLAADRSGMSRLKDELSAEDVKGALTPRSERSRTSQEEEEEEDEDEDDEDFLAREMCDS